MALLARRATVAVLALALSAGIASALSALAPGDAIDMLPDSDRLRPALEAKWGLDQPPLTRIALAWSRLASGDFGTSYVLRPGASVVELAAGPLARTAARVTAAALVLLGVSLWITLRGAEPSGSAPRAHAPHSPADPPPRSTSAAAQPPTQSAHPPRAAPASPSAGAAADRIRAALSLPLLLPLFLLAHLAVGLINSGVAAGLARGWWARPAWFAMPIEPGWPREVLGVLLLAAASGTLAATVDALRARADAVRRAPFFEMAMCRGDDLRRLTRRHLWVPAVDELAARLPALLAGVVVAEHALLLPGAGSLFFEAAEQRDHELLTSLALAAGAAVLVSRWLALAVGMWIDPRRAEAAE